MGRLIELPPPPQLDQAGVRFDAAGGLVRLLYADAVLAELDPRTGERLRLELTRAVRAAETETPAGQRKLTAAWAGQACPGCGGTGRVESRTDRGE